MKIEYRIFTWIFVVVFFLLCLSLYISPGIYLLKYSPKAMDFLAFYTGAKMLSVSPTDLYNLHAQQNLQQHIDPIVKTFGVFIPFLNPPFVAFMIQGLMPFGLINGYVVFLGVNILVLLLISYITLKQCKKISWHYALVFTLIVATFVPLLLTLLVGQLSIFLCASFFFAWLYLRKGQEFKGGLILSLILIKPHFFVLPLLALLVQRRIRLLAGFMIGALLLVGISYLCVGWAGMISYVMLLNIFYATSSGYNINIMAQHSLQTLLLLLFHSQRLEQIRIYWFIAILSIVIPTLFVWTKKLSFSTPKFSFQFALLIIATLITSPHTHYYDLSLLLIITFILLTHLQDFRKRQKKLFISLILFSYCIPAIGYSLFVFLTGSQQEIWVIPTIIYLIVFWAILFKELIMKPKDINPHRS